MLLSVLSAGRHGGHVPDRSITKSGQVKTSRCRGLSFAIPVDLASGIASELIDGGKVTRPSLGMQVVIVEVDGEPAHTADALIVKTLQLNAGDVIHLTYERQGASHTTELTLSAE